MPAPFTDEERRLAFWEKVEIRGPDECWPWTASTTSGGQGKVRWDGREIIGSHRVAFYLMYNRWPDHACHTCDNPPCCNPSHIYDGTKSTNAKDFYARDPRAPAIRAAISARARLPRKKTA